MMVVLDASTRVSAMPSADSKRHPAVRRFLARAALFVAILLLLDYALGAVLTYGLKRYFGIHGNAPVLCVGHSRMVLGTDAEILEQALGVPVAKYTIRGANAADRFAMIRHFLTEHLDVRVILYDVESTSFYG